MNYRIISLVFNLVLGFCAALAQKIEPLKYGDFSNWVTRHIHESSIIGGQTKTVYEIAPKKEITGNTAYTNMGGSPWATSNVYAKVAGITKTSNAVYPYKRDEGNLCAQLCTQIESVKVLGMVNMDVLVAGSIFLGQMFEPISSTSNPYKKMEMGIPFNKRPKSLVLDYKVDMPDTDIRTKSTGFSSKKTLTGRDAAVVFVFLQYRWEDNQGNIHAKRIGTGGELFKCASGWRNRHEIPIIYGDCSSSPEMTWLGLRNGEQMYCARNSKGKVVPVREEQWGTGNETPTHIIIMISSGKGEPYVGTIGLTFYVDNIGLKY